jgi:hypothetical protein
MRASFGRIVLVLLLSTAIALTISWLAELDPHLTKPGGEPLVAFRNTQMRMLTEETIVDEIVALRLHAQIKRVHVGNRMLEVDLEIAPGEIAAKSIRTDIGALAKLGLADASNISRVFVRVHEKKNDPGDNGAKTLLLALTAGIDDFTGEELNELREGETKAEDWFGSKLKLTTTERWRSLGN